MIDLKTYLLDDNLNDIAFDSTFNQIIIHKEKLNDRFTVLYHKYKAPNLKQESYNVGGYFDVKDKVIYDIDYQINKLIGKDSIITEKSLINLENELLKNINEYIEKYSLDNADILKTQSYETYQQKDDWRIRNLKLEVEELFIKNEEPKIELDKFYRVGKLTNSTPFYNKDILIEYLNDKDRTVEKYSEELINDIKEELGLGLNFFDEKIRYMELIKLNKNNEFKNLYINKKIYEAIKDVPAKTLNITIKYNNKEITFKGDYCIFKDSIMRAEIGTSFYGAAYHNVSDFIKHNSDSKNNWRNDFEFSHILSITYGKKELYRNDNIREKKNMERCDR